jgi:hypothetical protein
MRIVSPLDNQRAPFRIDHNTGDAHRVAHVLTGQLVTPINSRVPLRLLDVQTSGAVGWEETPS